MTAQEPDPRLPARVHRAGGALASVLAWDQHLVTLDKAQMFVIADIVGKFPELNTEFAVDLLADAAGYHKQQMGDWFDRLIDDYGIDAVYLAIECLEATGLRTAEESAASNSLDEDVALVLTAGATSTLDAQILSSQLAGLADAKSIRDALMNASVTSKDDRTVLVITGPYERYVDPMVFDLTRAVAALEARVDALTQAQRQSVDAPVATFDEPLRRLEDNLAAQIAKVSEDVRGKAGSIDFIELDEKMKAFTALVEDRKSTRLNSSH